ncbi:hypothetical protein BZJ19_11305 [Salinivibrio proteolyticus]|nr:hypothetical protein BZG83_12120 [Salinivibrio sp. PR919]OOF16726.1 hypothetical protein BZG84_09905 [Salinivibrio sp. PR932]OOF24474.1 hypothetical protein BZJ19_11305 [Salinivibrio proteolyticus]OOF25110.1 hypothetical protein BZJ18_12485 [Salinivibrio sp. IB872]PCE65115.1 hypothetical protein B6G00_14060 [Salinivibrio sp. YCSC6]
MFCLCCRGFVVLTPCIGLCRREEDVCVGCKRTLDEIIAWGKMTDDQRAAIMAELPQRPDPKPPEPIRPSRNPFKRRFS